MTPQPKFLSLKSGEPATVRFLPPVEGGDFGVVARHYLPDREWPARYGRWAPKRKRPKRIAKKIAQRGGWMTHAYGGGNLAELMLIGSRQFGRDCGETINRKVLERWNDANQDVIDELVERGVSRAERKTIYRALRRMAPAIKDPGAL